MKILLNILFLLHFFDIFGQSKFEKLNTLEQSYVIQSDDFLKKNIGEKHFNNYFSFNWFWYYSQQGTITRFPKYVEDSTVTHIMTDYKLIIPEISYSETIVLIYDAKQNIRYFRDSVEIPNYILFKRELEMIDTLEVNAAITKANIKLTNNNYGSSCSYDKNLNRFVWTIVDTVVPFDSLNNSYTVSQYYLDAFDGQLLKEEKNIEIHYMPRGVR
jgi:hypothetical protein